MTRAPVTRRRALGVIALGAAGIAVGTTGWVSDLGAPAGSGGRLQPGASGQPLAEPAVLASRDGVLGIELTAAAGVALRVGTPRHWGTTAAHPGRRCGWHRGTCSGSG